MINDHLSGLRPTAHQNAMNELAGTSEHCKTFRHNIKVYQVDSRAHIWITQRHTYLHESLCRLVGLISNLTLKQWFILTLETFPLRSFLGWTVSNTVVGIRSLSVSSVTIDLQFPSSLSLWLFSAALAPALWTMSKRSSRSSLAATNMVGGVVERSVSAELRAKNGQRWCSGVDEGDGEATLVARALTAAQRHWLNACVCFRQQRTCLISGELPKGRVGNRSREMDEYLESDQITERLCLYCIATSQLHQDKIGISSILPPIQPYIRSTIKVFR